MQTIFLDGEAKSGKTTVGSAILEALSSEYKVYSAVAGSFYRRLTLLALKSHGIQFDPDNLLWLQAGMREAIDGGEAYDETRDWSGLDKSPVNELVSVAGQYDFVQAAGREWWRNTADRALAEGADVLLLDGRNPRAKLADWRSTHDVPVALDLCIHCDVEVAGKRLLASEGVKNPSPEQLAAATNKIQTRRDMDRDRAHSPYVEPAGQLAFSPEHDSAERIVAQSFAEGAADPPRVIGFDTSHSTVDMTKPIVATLARAAVAFPKKS